MPADPLDHLGPTNEELLQLVFREVDDAMLREIANADVPMHADACFSALHAIRTGSVPATSVWEASEELALIRWSEPEDPAWKPGSVGARGHWMRLFACSLLIRAAAEPENYACFNEEDATVIQLVDSATRLGPDASRAALRFLCWRLQSRTLQDWERPPLAVGTLLLSVLLDLCDSQTAGYLIAAAKSDDGVLSELCSKCLRAQKWRSFVHRVLVDSTATTKEIQQFGNLLIGSANEG